MHQTPIQTLLVCEFITAGGFNHAPLPPKLVHEAMLMRDALLRDLSSLPYQVIVTHDARLERPANVHQLKEVGEHDDVWAIWESLIQTVDAVWMIAPETDGLLLRLARLTERYQKNLLGCHSTAIAVCADKLQTYDALLRAGLPTIASYSADDWPKTPGRWLAKPRDGAGCEDTVYFDAAEDMEAWLSLGGRRHTHMVQPFVSGLAASVSCVVHGGMLTVLSSNQQHVVEQAGHLTYQGSVVNGFASHWALLEALARRVAHAIPGLVGYIGIDMLIDLSADQPQACVVEINPRLTTSYVGLHAAIGHNPAALVIGSITQPQFSWPVLQRQQVEIKV